MSSTKVKDHDLNGNLKTILVKFGRPKAIQELLLLQERHFATRAPILV